MAKRERDCNLMFWVTQEERSLIEQKMQAAGVTNMSQYLRKMAMDGIIVRLELPELHELLSLLRRSSANLNQLAKRVHGTGRFYDADMEDLQQSQERLQAAINSLMAKFTDLL